MNKYYKILIVFVLVPGLWVGLNSLGPTNPIPAIAQDDLFEDILEGVLEEVREEIKQDIKNDVRRETSEVVAEEQLSPSNSLSGIYLHIDPVEGPFFCDLTITPTNITGSCGDITDAITTFSGSSIDGIFYNFNYTFTDIKFSCGPVTGTGTATVVSGTGEPGTEIFLTISPNACDSSGGGEILVKQ